MARHTATPSFPAGAYDINSVDADGIGQRVFTVMSHSHPMAQYDPRKCEDAARLLTIALSLPGGIEAATALLRAELVRSGG